MTASYRLQLRPDFGFDAVAELADYLSALGVTHAYLSPVAEAEPGSTHGYDVVDPTRVRVELGGEAAFERMLQALSQRGLQVLLDIVPNHMSIASTANRWWWDVLENGPSSRYAASFDVDWSHAHAASDRILLPILGERYGEAIASGLVRVERHGGNVIVKYRERGLPAAPRALDRLLHAAAARANSDLLAFFGDALDSLPHATATDRESTHRRHRDKDVIAQLLQERLTAEPALATALDAEIAALNADPAELDALLERQNYRLAYWGTAASELPYRRFFDIHTLVGLRMEERSVFEESHARVLDWLQRGLIDGVRIDHPDGLRDPETYLARLRAAAPQAWVVVEKILQPDEPPRSEVMADGTTGYDTLNWIAGLFVEREHEARMLQLAEELTGEPQRFATIAEDAKREALASSLGSEISRLTELASACVSTMLVGRDYTRREIWDALVELLIAMPIYRTYVRPDTPVRAEDVAVIAQICRVASERRPQLAPVIGLLCALLRREHLGGDELIARFQQTAAAVMAKGVEDTAFYRYVPLLALNEVGGCPERFGVEVADFHAAMRRAAPRSLIATATHDTKRGEDTRARNAVLSEVPDRFAALVCELRELCALHPAPDAHAAYYFFQTWVSAYPLSEERALEHMRKAVREAKRRTSWTRVDAQYETALESFVREMLGDARASQRVADFVAEIAPYALRNSLAQTLLKLTLPGVPDLYQGTELWDFSLVDPDNRRLVDYAPRRALLAEVEALDAECAFARAEAGVPKLWLIQRVLQLRRREPQLFEGEHVPLEVQGAHARNAVAYARGSELVVVVPRLTARVGEQRLDAEIVLPNGQWLDLVGGASASKTLPLWRVLERFPVALLRRQA